MRSANYSEDLLNVCMLSSIITVAVVILITIIIINNNNNNNNNNIANNCGKKEDWILIQWKTAYQLQK